MTKLTVILSLLCVLQLSATVYSQTTRLTLNSKNKTVKQVFLDIEDQSEFRFFYNEKFMDLDKRVTFDISDEKIDDILVRLLESSNVTYKVMENNLIVITPSENSQQQSKTITGKVTDQSGAPMPGVTLIVKGTTQGTISDADGNYSLANVPADATLVFSFVGMKTQEIPVARKTNINVTLTEEAIGIGEVVAIGYGTARRKDLTGSVSSVGIEESPLSMTPNINILQTMKGTTPGLNIGEVNEAGENPSILVRGQNSINASNYPLIVLDGVVFLGSIGDINPADVASIDVLKDASSTAVYGSRAANGVIIIKTKKGKTGKPILSFSASGGVHIWNTKPKVASLDKWMEKTSLLYGNSDPLEWMVLNERDNYQDGISYYWPDIYSRTGEFQDYQFNISGIKEDVDYYLSAGYADEKGVIWGDDYNRISLKGRINTHITDWIQVGVDGTYNRSDYSGAGVPSLKYSYTYSSMYRGDQKTEHKLLEKWPAGEKGVGLIPSSMHPLWITDANPENVIDDVDIRNTFLLSTFVHIKMPFLEGLSYRLNYSTNYRLFKQERFYYENYFIDAGSSRDLSRYTPEVVSAYLGQCEGYVNDRKIKSYVLDNIINFRREIDKHFIDVTLVATRDYQSDRSFRLEASDFLENGSTSLGIDGITLAKNLTNTNSHNEFSNIGYLARINYTFNNKYHLTSSFRRDASSVFGARNKWGNFPSVGIAWTPSEEDFLKNNNIINYLKVRASYGKNGNQGISAYETLSRVATGSTGGIRYQFSDNPGVSYYGLQISSLGNDLLGWETTTSLNFGFETSLLDERIFLNFDYYTSKTTDQLFVRQIPIMTGFSSIRASMGQVDNKGVELSLKTVNIQNKDFSWTSDLTFSENRNILNELYGDGLDDIGSNLFIGKSLGAIYGFEWDGIVQEDDTEYIAATGANPGDAKLKDLNGDGLITADGDRKILGYTKENFRLNLSNTFNYRNFQLYIQLSGIFGGGRDNYYMKRNEQAYLSSTGSGIRADFLDKVTYWTEENPSDKYPSPFYYDNTRFFALQPRTFVKVQDIILSYTIKSDWVRDMKISGLKVFGSVHNLYTFTGWDGDPEIGSTALASSYPVPATFTLGFNLKF